MLRISVNGTTCNTASGPENWGDLLNLLEEGDGASRQVVTAVRFDGVAVPTFREPIQLTRELDVLGPIAVETCTVDDLLHVSAQSAFASIAPLKTATLRIAARLRTEEAPVAARDLSRLIASIQTLATLTAALGRARACAEPHRGDFDAIVRRLSSLADSVIAHQMQGEWFTVAAVLERELTPTLDAWVLVARRVWSIA